MIIGGLSEQEINKITNLLDTEEIKYKVKSDQSMMQANTDSMQNNLRHLNAPSISIHVLAIELEENVFEKISVELRAKLLDFGITDYIPTDLEFSEAEPELIQSEINRGNTRIIGHGIFHQLLVGAGAFLLYALYNYFS